MKPQPVRSTKARPQESASRENRSRQEVGWRVTARPQEMVALICLLALCSCTSTKTKMAQSYDLGQSDATKELYWSKVRMQQMQSQQQTPPAAPNVTMYPIVHPAHTAAGVNYKEYTDYIPVSNPNNN